MSISLQILALYDATPLIELIELACLMLQLECTKEIRENPPQNLILTMNFLLAHGARKVMNNTDLVRLACEIGPNLPAGLIWPNLKVFPRDVVQNSSQPIGDAELEIDQIPQPEQKIQGGEPLLKSGKNPRPRSIAQVIDAICGHYGEKSPQDLYELESEQLLSILNKLLDKHGLSPGASSTAAFITAWLGQGLCRKTVNKILRVVQQGNSGEK